MDAMVRVGRAVALAALAVGCAGKQEAAGPGQDCYRDADCQVGLVCVPDAAGVRTCGSDVTGLAENRPGPPAPPPDAGMTVEDAAAAPEDAAVEPEDAQ